jgi:hypothetical protein
MNEGSGAQYMLEWTWGKNGWKALKQQEYANK